MQRRNAVPLSLQPNRGNRVISLNPQGSPPDYVRVLRRADQGSAADGAKRPTAFREPWRPPLSKPTSEVTVSPSASENILKARHLRVEADRARRLRRGVSDDKIARRLERYAAAVERAAQRLERQSREDDGLADEPQSDGDGPGMALAYGDRKPEGRAHG